METETKNTSTLTLDNSGRSNFCQCKQKYFLQTINGWHSNYGSTALRFGSTWHKIQEAYHNWVMENGWPKDQAAQMSAMAVALTAGNAEFIKETGEKQFYDDYKNFNTAVDMFNEYLDFFTTDKTYTKIIHTEQVFTCPIEPENALEDKLLSKLPPILFTGKIDQCIELDRIKWLLDFKTTGWRLDQVIAKANRSPQLIGYSYAGKKVLDFEPEGCMCSFAYFGSTKSRVTGDYGKVRFEFRRIPQIFTPGDISAWKLSFIDTAREIKYAIDENLFPESFDNCHMYGACPYLKLCLQHRPYAELNFEGFHVAHWSVLDNEE